MNKWKCKRCHAIVDMIAFKCECTQSPSPWEYVEELTSQDTFEKELEYLINRYSKENKSNTPDFILAQYINDSLSVFNDAVNAREKWYGRKNNRELSVDKIETPLEKTDDVPTLVGCCPQCNGAFENYGTKLQRCSRRLCPTRLMGRSSLGSQSEYPEYPNWNNKFNL